MVSGAEGSSTQSWHSSAFPFPKEAEETKAFLSKDSTQKIAAVNSSSIVTSHAWLVGVTQSLLPVPGTRGLPREKLMTAQASIPSWDNDTIRRVLE